MSYVIVGALGFVVGGGAVAFVLWRIFTKSASEWW